MHRGFAGRRCSAGRARRTSDACCAHVTNNSESRRAVDGIEPKQCRRPHGDERPEPNYLREGKTHWFDASFNCLPNTARLDSNGRGLTGHHRPRPTRRKRTTGWRLDVAPVMIAIEQLTFDN